MSEKIPDDATKDERGLPFDVDSVAILRQAHAIIFARHPEVRSIGSTLDFFGQLNDSNIQKGVWTSDHGPVDTVDGIFGSMFQTLRLLEEQFSRAIDHGVQMRDEVQALTAECVRLRGQHEQLEKIFASKAETLARAGIDVEVPVDG